MMPEDILKIFQEGGMTAVAAAMFGLAVWLVKKLLSVIKASNQVIAGNTQILKELKDGTAEERKRLSWIRDKLMERPCLLEDPDFRAKVEQIIAKFYAAKEA